MRDIALLEETMLDATAEPLHCMCTSVVHHRVVVNSGHVEREGKRGFWLRLRGSKKRPIFRGSKGPELLRIDHR